MLNSAGILPKFHLWEINVDDTELSQITSFPNKQFTIGQNEKEMNLQL